VSGIFVWLDPKNYFPVVFLKRRDKSAVLHLLTNLADQPGFGGHPWPERPINIRANSVIEEVE